MLTAEQRERREGKLTGSRIAALMSGDDAQVYALWRELVGDPLHVEENLDDVWAVQLGNATEQLNLDWFARRRGDVTDRGRFFNHPSIEWAGCTLDGWSQKHDCPIECKHVGGHEPPSTIIDRYQPQMQWTMWVTGTKQIAFSVIYGAAIPVIDFIPYDGPYVTLMVNRAHKFMEHVFDLIPPVTPPAAPAPVIPVQEYDMTGSNAWAEHAGVWLANIASKSKAEKADKAIKELVPRDAIRCHGYGVQVKRFRNGNLSISELKS